MQFTAPLVASLQIAYQKAFRGYASITSSIEAAWINFTQNRSLILRTNRLILCFLACLLCAASLIGQESSLSGSMAINFQKCRTVVAPALSTNMMTRRKGGRPPPSPNHASESSSKSLTLQDRFDRLWRASLQTQRLVMPTCFLLIAMSRCLRG